MAIDREKLAEAIADDATEGIESVTVDGMTVRTRSLNQRIRALESLRRDEAAKKGRLPLRFTKVISKELL